MLPAFTIERAEVAPTSCPMKWLGAGGQAGPIYIIKHKDKALWAVGIDHGDAAHVPFREEFYWTATKTMVIGGGNTVYFLAVDSGDLRAKIDVPSYFGHLELIDGPGELGTTEQMLLILGWTDVHAIDTRFLTRWVARNVAVDGVVFCEMLGNELIFNAEMDPPGGWVEVALSVQTGIELWRNAPGG